MHRLPIVPAVSCLLALALAGCGDGAGDDNLVAPVELGTVMLRAAAEAGPDELSNQHLSPGRPFEVRQLEMPDLHCVRTDSDDYLHIPEVTSTPGGPAVFYAVAPADAGQPILIVFHGNGLDFIEAAAALLAHTKPELTLQLLAADPGVAGYIEIDNRGGALRGVRGVLDSAYVAEALERGWGVVAPGNCWGDGGHGSGEVVDYYIRAPRYGHLMDARVWEWYRNEYPHDPEREYSFGCSGGGQRTAQFLLHDPLATAASAIDSPADYLPGFLEDPPDLFALVADIPAFPDILNDFYIGHYGGLEEAAQQSLGTQLTALGIETPIYLAYSVDDPFTTAAVTAPLAQALADRNPADRAAVWNTAEPVHCQINTRARARDALDWLARWTRSDARVTK